MSPMKTVYFDLETGGLNDEPVIQLAAVAVNANWSEAGTFEQKITFDPATCDPEALKLNGYSEDAWKGSVLPGFAAQKFAAFVKPHSTVEMVSKRTGAPYSVARLAGYNALTFDLPRLRGLFGEMFFPCSYHVRDVLQRAMFYFDEHPEAEKPKDLKLGTVCAYFGISVDGAHEALSDVRMTVALHRKLAGFEQ